MLGAIRPLEGAVKPGFINGPIPNVLKSPALRREIFKIMDSGFATHGQYRGVKFNFSHFC